MAQMVHGVGHPMNGDERRIHVWPDGAWLDAGEHEDALEMWRGDDFLVIHVPHGLEDEVVDEIARAKASGMTP